MIDVVEQAAIHWNALDSLIRDDLSVTAVEFGRFGSSYYECLIRRNRPIHVIHGYGSSPAEALREARRLYYEATE